MSIFGMAASAMGVKPDRRHDPDIAASSRQQWRMQRPSPDVSWRYALRQIRCNKDFLPTAADRIRNRAA
jgi:hypothetical protein